MVSCSSARVAFEQLHAEFTFERTDLARQHRLCDVQPLGCAAEVQFFGDCHEVTEFAHVEVGRRPYRQGIAPRRKGSWTSDHNPARQWMHEPEERTSTRHRRHLRHRPGCRGRGGRARSRPDRGVAPSVQRRPRHVAAAGACPRRHRRPHRPVGSGAAGRRHRRHRTPRVHRGRVTRTERHWPTSPRRSSWASSRPASSVR